MSPLQRAFLDKRIDEERMTARDPRDDAPLLPSAARVQVMDAAGVVRAWIWADSISWWEAYGWRIDDSDEANAGADGEEGDDYFELDGDIEESGGSEGEAE